MMYLSKWNIFNVKKIICPTIHIHTCQLETYTDLVSKDEMEPVVAEPVTCNFRPRIGCSQRHGPMCGSVDGLIQDGENGPRCHKHTQFSIDRRRTYQVNRVSKLKDATSELEEAHKRIKELEEELKNLRILYEPFVKLATTRLQGYPEVKNVENS